MVQKHVLSDLRCYGWFAIAVNLYHMLTPTMWPSLSLGRCVKSKQLKVSATHSTVPGCTTHALVFHCCIFIKSNKTFPNVLKWIVEKSVLIMLRQPKGSGGAYNHRLMDIKAIRLTLCFPAPRLSWFSSFPHVFELKWNGISPFLTPVCVGFHWATVVSFPGGLVTTSLVSFWRYFDKVNVCVKAFRKDCPVGTVWYLKSSTMKAKALLCPAHLNCESFQILDDVLLTKFTNKALSGWAKDPNILFNAASFEDHVFSFICLVLTHPCPNLWYVKMVSDKIKYWIIP